MPLLKHLESDFARLDQLETIHSFLDGQTTNALDLSDLLRAEYVQVISALDRYIHDLTLSGMLDVFSGNRKMPPAFQKFTLPTSLALQIASPPMGISPEMLFEQEIRNKHSFLSFQQPDKIADAVRLFCEIELWKEVAIKLSVDVKVLKEKLTNIVDRRNKIAHESDKKPGFPNELWPIDRQIVNDTKIFIKDLCYSINTVTK